MMFEFYALVDNDFDVSDINSLTYSIQVLVGNKKNGKNSIYGSEITTASTDINIFSYCPDNNFLLNSRPYEKSMNLDNF